MFFLIWPSFSFSHFNLSGCYIFQVEQELIYYVHDDSEELMDSFTVIVNNTELWKQSLPQTVFVTVTAVNDEAPVIKVNRILRVCLSTF